MVLLTTTPPILAAIEALPPTSRHDFSLPDTLNLEDPISHDQLIKIARYFRQTDTSSSTSSIDETKTLNSLLRGTKVYIPPPPKKPEPVNTYPQHLPNTIPISIFKLTNDNKHRVPNTSPSKRAFSPQPKQTPTTA